MQSTRPTFSRATSTSTKRSRLPRTQSRACWPRPSPNLVSHANHSHCNQQQPTMTKPIASLSLDLDNKWCYLRTHGVAGWDKYPSYLDTVVPRVLRACTARDLQLTCFVVGRDAAIDDNADALTALAAAGHEMANHSFSHEPWLHTLPRARL